MTVIEFNSLVMEAQRDLVLHQGILLGNIKAPSGRVHFLYEVLGMYVEVVADITPFTVYGITGLLYDQIDKFLTSVSLEGLIA